MKKGFAVTIISTVLTLVPFAGIYAFDFSPVVSPNTNVIPGAAAHVQNDSATSDFTFFILPFHRIQMSGQRQKWMPR
jgi:hypothetical protein